MYRVAGRQPYLRYLECGSAEEVAGEGPGNPTGLGRRRRPATRRGGAVPCLVGERRRGFWVSGEPRVWREEEEGDREKPCLSPWFIH